MSDQTLGKGEVLILTGVIVSYVLIYVVRRLRRRRPDFRIGVPIAVAVIVRFLFVLAINATGSLQASLRGGDEQTFLYWARFLAGTPWGHGFFPHSYYQLQVVVFAIQLKLLHSDATALRETQIGLATLGVIFLLAAVHDLSGPRPARLAAWLLAFEPGTIFFQTELHKEALSVLAIGLVVFGGTQVWRRLDLYGFLFMALGGFVGVETRSYMGWFLVAGSVFVILHAAFRRLNRPGVALPIIYAILLAGVLVAPTLLTLSSAKSLRTLQNSQNYTTIDQVATNSGAAGGDNLADEAVNFSSRGAVITGLPGRVFDLVFRPYPWQLHDTSQELGAVDSVLVLAGLAFLVGYIWRRRGRVLSLSAPILYPLVFMAVAFSLSAGNAGTGFRYRTDLVPMVVAILVILRENVLAARTAEPSVPRVGAAPAQPLESELVPA